MKKIVLFDPSYGTLNMGDHIINEAVMAEMDYLFSESFVARFSTHTPVLHGHQMLLSNKIREFCLGADLKFLGGTNLIKSTLINRKPGWNLNLSTARLYRNSIALGCGYAGSGGIKEPYTRKLYRDVLSRDVLHSTRDQRTQILLESMGLRAINTGCPTMWALTPEHCLQIPTQRGTRVVTTLTDYARDPAADRELIRTLRDGYDEVLVWVQGSLDYEYLVELGILDDVTLIAPTLAAYQRVLEQPDIDYVGTRLHAGIYAMRHKKRALIVAVDHRAVDIHETHNINVVPRRDVSELSRLIDAPLVTDVKIKQDVIDAWKGQFLSA